MGFGFKQPLVGEKRCVTTLVTAAKETRQELTGNESKSRLEGASGVGLGIHQEQRSTMVPAMH